MSAFAKRSTLATHVRQTTTFGAPLSFADLGTLRIHVPVVAVAAQTGGEIAAPTAEFNVYFDPKVDLQPGDLLVFSGEPHEVVATRRLPGKRFDHAVAEVVRKEVPDFTLP